MYVIAGLGIPELSELQGILSARGGPFNLLAPQPFPHASTVPNESVPGGVLESSCGGRRRLSIENGQNVGEPTFQ